MQISNKDIELIKRYRECFSYDEKSPTCLAWKSRVANCVKIGAMAGGPHWSGYWYVRLDGQSYAAHRVVYGLINGYLPDEVDHIDLNRSNNKISNLRASTTSQNECNKGIQRNNTSGVKGVNWDKSSGMWKARVAVNGKTRYAGRFHNIKDAEQAVIAMRSELHGEFARSAA
ncbi:HNH endonuclease [Serratia quinivorans]|uniref:HNH endonuclease n=1 Tax=Serratia quinivorans TaxID=137545 RepID=UPI003F9E821D